MKLLRNIFALLVLLAAPALANSAYPSYYDAQYPTRASLSTIPKATAISGTFKHICITENGYAGCYDAIADSLATVDGVTVLAFADSPTTGRWIRNSSSISGLGTGVTTALGVNVGSAGALVTNGGALGTPASGTLTNATGLPLTTGISGFGAGAATALGINIGSSGSVIVNGGAARVIFGTNSPVDGELAPGITRDDNQLTIARTATNPISKGGSHAIRDESVYNPGGASGGYASYDCIYEYTGTAIGSHASCFQARILYTNTAKMDALQPFTSSATLAAGTSVGSMINYRAYDTLGTGTLDFQYGFWCDNWTKATTKVCFYNGGGAANFLGTGNTTIQTGGSLTMQTGTTIKFQAMTTYGALLSHGGDGTVLDNPNLTIVNGVLTFASSTAKALASTTNLQLESTSGTVLLRPAGATQMTVESTGVIVEGTLQFGTYTNTTCTNAGYITIKDHAGNDRKVMICS